MTRTTLLALLLTLPLPIGLLALSGATSPAPAYAAPATSHALTPDDTELLLSLTERGDRADKIDALRQRFSRSYVAPALELYGHVGDPALRAELLDGLRRTTGQDHGRDINAWYRWLWNEPETKVAGYADFKAAFYRRIDRRFARYFEGRQDSARIRLDEIRWGGVRQDGIPPLRSPKMLRAEQADYLDDADIVFGIEVNGDVRAYPKRILAWHEMFTDTVGGVDVAGVYCTLCGTVILYDVGEHRLGTSGFLYRSNKLMYDADTQSLWNTLQGAPVLGPLVDRGIELPHRSVVTTTWGKWRDRHPDTQVLSLDTGHRRDYREGVAYHDYFADDELMFNTPFADSRLANKTEVLALRFRGPGQPTAISTDFLKANPVYRGRTQNQDFVVLTDETGANRVYDPKGVTLVRFDGGDTAQARDGSTWRVTEAKLIGPDGEELPRLPYHRAFWFGWHASYPNSELVK